MSREPMVRELLEKHENGTLSAHLNTTRLDLAGTQVTSTAAELNTLDGAGVVPTASKALVPGTDGATDLLHCEEVTFTENTVNTTFTGTVVIPAGATLVDVIIHAVALWNDGTAAVMKVGDTANDDGWFTAVDLKATDLLAGESIQFGYTGGQEGADLDGGESAGDHVRGRFYATADVVTGVVTVTAKDGTTGVTRMTVLYSLPSTVTVATASGT